MSDSMSNNNSMSDSNSVPNHDSVSNSDSDSVSNHNPAEFSSDWNSLSVSCSKSSSVISNNSSSSMDNVSSSNGSPSCDSTSSVIVDLRVVSLDMSFIVSVGSIMLGSESSNVSLISDNSLSVSLVVGSVSHDSFSVHLIRVVEFIMGLSVSDSVSFLNSSNS